MKRSSGTLDLPICSATPLVSLLQLVQDDLGARNLLLIGMATSLITNIILVCCQCLDHHGVHGGEWTRSGNWMVSTVGVMANWTTRSERGTLMGVWATCYQFGGVAATAWAAWWLSMQGWRGAFFAASSVLTLIWFYVYFFVATSQRMLVDVGRSR